MAGLIWFWNQPAGGPSTVTVTHTADAILKGEGNAPKTHTADAVIEHSVYKVTEASNANSGAQTSISVSITTPTAGHLLIAAIASDKNAGTYTPPTGFTVVQDQSNTSVSGAIAWKIAVGDETAIAWSQSSSSANGISAWVGEYAGNHATTPIDVSAETNNDESVVTSRSSGTTATTAIAKELAVAMWAADTSSSVDTTRAYTNSFTESAFVTQGAGGPPGLIIAEKDLSSTGTVETTFSCVDTGDQIYGAILTIRPVGAVTATVTHTADAIVKVLDVTKTHTADAVLKKLDVTVSYTADAVIKALDVTVTHTSDAILKAEGVVVTHTADAILKKLDVTVSHTADAVIPATVTVAHTADAILKETRTVSYTADAVLKGTGAVGHTADAVLKATSTVTHTAGAVLVYAEGYNTLDGSSAGADGSTVTTALLKDDGTNLAVSPAGFTETATYESVDKHHGRYARLSANTYSFTINTSIGDLDAVTVRELQVYWRMVSGSTGTVLILQLKVGGSETVAVELDVAGKTLRLQRSSGGTTNSSTQAIELNRWYRLRLIWSTSGTQTLHIYDGEETTPLATKTLGSAMSAGPNWFLAGITNTLSDLVSDLEDIRFGAGPLAPEGAFYTVSHTADALLTDNKVFHTADAVVVAQVTKTHTADAVLVWTQGYNSFDGAADGEGSTVTPARMAADGTYPQAFGGPYGADTATYESEEQRHGRYWHSVTSEGNAAFGEWNVTGTQIEGQFYFRPRAAGATGTEFPLAGIGDSSGTRYLYLYWKASTNEVLTIISSAEGADGTSLVALPAYDRWYRIRLVYSDSGPAHIYIYDGEEPTTTLLDLTTGNPSTGFDVTANRVVLGSQAEGSGGIFDLDDLRFGPGPLGAEGTVSTLSHTADAVLKKTDITLSHTADAVLRATVTAAHTADAILKKSDNVLTHTADAVLFSVSTSTVSHTADAIVRATATLSHTADAVLRATATVSHTADAVLKATTLATHTADAVLLKTETRTHTADAIVRATNTVSHLADANLKGATALSHIADAVVAAVVTVSHTADAILNATPPSPDIEFPALADPSLSFIARPEPSGSLDALADPGAGLTASSETLEPMAPLSEWTASAGAPTYASGVWTLADGDSIVSPLIYCADAAYGYLTYELWTDTQTPYVPAQPLGGYLGGTQYFKADGVTPAFNNDGFPGPYVGNGNAQFFATSAWTVITWSAITLGNEVVYLRASIHNDANWVGGILKVRAASILLYDGLFVPVVRKPDLGFSGRADSGVSVP